jgi:NarL family two-component system response regulator LiaR
MQPVRDGATRPIRVLLADDHAMVRDGQRVFLSNYPDIEVVGEAADGQEAVALCAQVLPDVVLMDMLMPELDGPTATAQIRAAYPQVQVIAVTSFLDEELIRRAIRAGAMGYLLKDINPASLADAIRAAHRGRPTIDSAAAHLLARAVQPGPVVGDTLTPREREVLALLAQGRTNGAIARTLTISEATVRLHVSHILAKLNAENRTEAATIAVQHQLVPAPHGE